jgi:chromosome segregation ATPase
LGYNLLIPRHKYLILEIEELKTNIDNLENTYTENTLELALLQEKLTTVEQSYQSLLVQYRETKSQINSLKLTINTLRPAVKYQKAERGKLEEKTKKLAAEIANLELKRARLDRDIVVCKSTFDKFAGLLENARVAKANQSSDIKIVAQAVEIIELSSKFLVTVLIFGLSGGLATLFSAFFVEYVKNAKINSE